MLIWASDIHLTHVRFPKNFGTDLAKENPDADGLIITGDIGTSNSLLGISDLKDTLGIIPGRNNLLKDLKEGFQKPIYIVLGNHDYFYSTFESVDNMIAKCTYIHHLTSKPIVIDSTTILGSEGWYDFLNGNVQTPVELEDMWAILDLDNARQDRGNDPGIIEAKTPDKQRVINVCRKRAGFLANKLYSQLCEVETNDILICTHVPPYKGAAWYRGEPSDADWLPWFSSKTMGEMIDRFALDNPDKNIKVICGHCHSSGYYQSPARVQVYTGKARFGSPDVCGVVYTDRLEVKNEKT